MTETFARSMINPISLDLEEAGTVVQVDPHTWTARSRTTADGESPVEYLVTRDPRAPRRWTCTCPSTRLCWHVRRTLREVLRSYGHRVTQFTSSIDKARAQHRPWSTYYRNGRAFYVVTSPIRRDQIPSYLAIRYRQANGRGLGLSPTITELRVGTKGEWREAKRHLTLVEFTQWAIDQGLRFDSRSTGNTSGLRWTTEIWTREEER